MADFDNLQEDKKENSKAIIEIFFILLGLLLIMFIVNALYFSLMGKILEMVLCGALAVVSALNIKNPYKKPQKLILWGIYVLAVLFVFRMISIGLTLYK